MFCSDDRLVMRLSVCSLQYFCSPMRNSAKLDSLNALASKSSLGAAAAATQLVTARLEAPPAAVVATVVILLLAEAMGRAAATGAPAAEAAVAAGLCSVTALTDCFSQRCSPEQVRPLGHSARHYNGLKFVWTSRATRVGRQVGRNRQYQKPRNLELRSCTHRFASCHNDVKCNELLQIH